MSEQSTFADRLAAIEAPTLLVFGRDDPMGGPSVGERMQAVMADAELVELIRSKYRIKNTVGYSLNALVDYHDPLDILIHLMVGSEGTLGWVADVTFRTVPVLPRDEVKMDDVDTTAEDHIADEARYRILSHKVVSSITQF